MIFKGICLSSQKVLVLILLEFISKRYQFCELFQIVREALNQLLKSKQPKNGPLRSSSNFNLEKRKIEFRSNPGFLSRFLRGSFQFQVPQNRNYNQWDRFQLKFKELIPSFQEKLELQVRDLSYSEVHVIVLKIFDTPKIFLIRFFSK